MKNIQTIEEILSHYILEDDSKTTCSFNKGEIKEVMRIFASLHVKEALKQASEKARIINDPNSYTGNTGSEYPSDKIVSIKSILKAYPLENIK